MAHHAYFIAGETSTSIASAHAFAEKELGISGSNSPDIITFTFGLFSVEDARKLIHSAGISSTSSTKVLIASFSRIFHEAQNALLKVLEEPPAGVTIILCVPSAGMFIPTLRSRLLPLPLQSGGNRDAEAPTNTYIGIAAEFLQADDAEREKIIAKLIDRSKSDKDEVKQGSRKDAMELLSGIITHAHEQLECVKTPKDRESTLLLLEETSSFMPILYDRAAPLKLMFEHLLLVIPKRSPKAKV